MIFFIFFPHLILGKTCDTLYVRWDCCSQLESCAKRLMYDEKKKKKMTPKKRYVNYEVELKEINTKGIKIKWCKCQKQRVNQSNDDEMLNSINLREKYKRNVTLKSRIRE